MARRGAVLITLLPAALSPLAASEPMAETPRASLSSVHASAMQVGTGGSAVPERPKTVAAALAEHTETVRKCQQLSVAAVRDECQRQAQRTLDGELARLQAKPGASR